MVRLVVLTKMFTGAVQSSFHCCHRDPEGLGNLPVAAALPDEREESAVLWTKLGKGVPEGVEFLSVDGSVGLGNVLMLGAKGQENPA
jgi:hypothetical protein